ncbi:CHAT domain-containing protein [Solwaraspora sp. WMMB335]|uniref:CHAT domain-containing protein n=1 Tax=Solwaraspora sp. WMMB335 TaxID=3404118 RepID=UPI003B96652B
MSRRPPRTSYGYLAPARAQVKGWECNNEGCNTGDDPAPRSWPYPCRVCGRPADATFQEPWAHEARRHKIARNLTSPDPFQRQFAQLQQHVWAYKDALFRNDHRAAADAWVAYHAERQRRARRAEYDPVVSTSSYEMILLAAEAGDFDRAIPELMADYPLIDTDDAETDNGRQTVARSFVSMCAKVLSQERSVEHPRADDLHSAMHDVADRLGDLLNPSHHQELKRVGEVRAQHRARTAIARQRRSVATAAEGLPPVSWPPPPDRPQRQAVPSARRLVDLLASDNRRALALIDGLLDNADLHDDVDPLDELIRHLAARGTSPALTRLLRARRQVVTGDLPGAIEQLRLGAGDTGHLARRLRPQILATHALLLARHSPQRIEDAVRSCQRGRRAGLRWWRRSTAADAALARLLLWRRRPGSDDVREAVRLSRRRCRPWRRPGVDDQILLQEVLAAYDAVTGRADDVRRHLAWRGTLDMSGSTAEQARLAAAWAEWALGSANAESAAEAYERLVALAAQDAVERSGTLARRRVLTAAQEYAEDAGYWLARTGRYREAVLALETGRAVGLTDALGRRDASRSSLSYDDVTAETGDGAIVFVSAAAAGGYALIVAADHDPQYVDLPRLDRTRVTDLLNWTSPATDTAAAGAARALGPGRLRELLPDRETTAGPLTDTLQAMWDDGVKELVYRTGGPVMTLIPVGLLSLLPLHAAGAPRWDRPAEWRHLGNYSAIRYAPNTRSLSWCRQVARELAHRQTLLAVDVPTGKGAQAATELRYVARETSEVTRRWTGQPTRPVRECTWKEFRSVADQHSVWHLAMHGFADPHRIMDSRLYFADCQVTLDELGGTLAVGRRRLAVLSACHTNLTGADLPNEIVGLPAALIELGFAGVIASAWAVDDLATTYLMTAFYERWCRRGDEPAIALQRAQSWLRIASSADLVAMLPGVAPAGQPGGSPYADPRYWAAFAYTGA